MSVRVLISTQVGDLDISRPLHTTSADGRDAVMRVAADMLDDIAADIRRMHSEEADRG